MSDSNENLGPTQSLKRPKILKKKLKSKRPKVEEPKAIDANNDALEKLNQLAQGFMESMGVDVKKLKIPLKKQPKKNRNKVDELNTFDNEPSTDSHPSIPSPEPCDKEKGPEVIVFNGAGLTKPSTSINTKAEFRQFMSSNVQALDREVVVKEKKKPKSDEDILNSKYDKELDELLHNSNAIKRLASSELVLKERRDFMLNQMVKLGAKPFKDAKKCTKTRIELAQKTRARQNQALEEARREGTFHKSLERSILNTVSHKGKLIASSTTALKAPVRNKKRVRSESLKVSLGRMKAGILHIDEKHIKKNNRIVAKKTKGLSLVPRGG